ncbi:unnamed protein product [Coffea canephora]|uniref:DH200=94 genomic scaffold, scaffold_290 n=1 Tax=Coffea canephora TaxID=49390 RepID=A0A068VDB3_COFCA|nr:unnamed protein product [Coffea canephora]
MFLQTHVRTNLLLDASSFAFLDSGMANAVSQVIWPFHYQTCQAEAEHLIMELILVSTSLLLPFSFFLQLLQFCYTF